MCLHLLEFVLAQVLDVQRFASFTQYFPFLLSLSLPLSAPFFCLWESEKELRSGLHPSHLNYVNLPLGTLHPLTNFCM